MPCEADLPALRLVCADVCNYQQRRVGWFADEFHFGKCDSKAVVGLLRGASMGCIPQGLKPRFLIAGECRARPT